MRNAGPVTALCITLRENIARCEVLVRHGIDTGMSFVILDKRGRVAWVVSGNDVCDPPPFFRFALACNVRTKCTISAQIAII